MTNTPAQVLRQLFYDLSEPTAFAGNPKYLVRELRKRFPRLENADKFVKDWLASRDEYTQFRRAFHHYKTPQIFVPPVAGYQLQMDLLDMYKYIDRGYRYILVVIDCLSRYAWLRPLQSKNSKEVAQAFSSIILNDSTEQKCHAQLVQTDAGKEFMGKPFQQLLQHHDIQFFTTPSNTKAAMAERLIRTLKERLMRYFRAKRSTRWHDVVSDFQHNYNHSPHRSLANYTPATVHSNPTLQGLVWQYIYKGKELQPVKFKVGDRVRISRWKAAFEKGFTDRWTLQMYTIHNILSNHNPAMYKLLDENGEVVKGAFNQGELQLVKPKQDEEENTQIEKVIDVDKTNTRDWRYFVKWKNQPSYMNQWLRELELDVETRRLLRDRYKQTRNR